MELRDRFNRFWPIFVRAHLNPRNRIFHLLGNVWMFGAWITFLVTGNWWWLALAFAGYAPSWIGHLVFEGNLPVTLGSPFVSALCDLKMMGLILTGNVDREVTRLFGSPRPPKNAPVIVSEDDERAYQERMRYVVEMDRPAPPFRDYWRVFLLKHQHPANIALHVFAMLFLYGLIVYVIATQRWHLLLAIPLSQMIGLLAHFTFERSYIDFEDAIFSWRAFSSLNRMLWLVLTGRYGAELARTKSARGD